MSSAAFRTCPVCGSRNKLKWEFCARCGESLQDVDPDAPTSVHESIFAPEVGVEPSSEPGEFRVPLSLVIGSIAVVVALYGYRQRENPLTVEPGLFTIPTQPPGPRIRPAPRPASTAEQSFHRGRELLQAGRAQEALPFFAQAVADAGSNALYRAYYGKAFFTIGNREDAIRQLQAASQIEPTSAEYRSDLARVLLAAGHRDDAAREYGRLLDTQPENTEALRTLARLKLEQGKTQDAIGLLRRAAGLGSGDGALAQDIAYALEQAGNLDEAGAAYSAILAKVPEAQITRSRLAEVLVKQERTQEAADLLREGISRYPNAPMLRRSLGSILDRTGDTAGAVAAYREYARLAPNAEDAKPLEARAAMLERRLTAQR